MRYFNWTRPALTLTLLAAVLPAASAGAAGWAPATSLDLGGPKVTQAAVAVDRTGTVAMVSDPNGAIRVAVKPPNGELTAEKTLTAMGQARAAIALDGNGNAIVMYEHPQTGSIRAAYRAADGTWTDLGVMSPKGSHPSVGFTSDGKAVMAWSQGTAVAFATRRADGSKGPGGAVGVALGAAVEDVAVATNPHSPDAEILYGSTSPDAVWVDAIRPTDQGVATETVRSQPMPSAFPDVLHLTAAMAPTGAVEAAWAEDYAIGGFLGIIDLESTSRDAGAGGKWHTVRQLDTVVTNGPGVNAIGEAHVAPLENGGAIVAWQRGRSDGSSSEARTASRAPGATTYVPGANLDASATTGSVIREVDLRPLPGSRALALWSRGDEVLGTLRSDGGKSVGEPVPSGGSAGLGQVELADDGVGDAVAYVRHLDKVFLARYDATDPEVRDVTVPAQATAGTASNFSASVFDALTTASAPAWDFGDGTGATGASVSHAYANPGVYNVSVSTTDAVGNHASKSATITVEAAPAGNAPAPRVTRFSITPRAFAVAPRATPAVARRAGASFLFSLTGRARVTISLRRCLPARHGRKARVKPCAGSRAAGSLSRTARAGANRVAFSGRVGRRALSHGLYRATIVARDSSGRRSAPRSLTFAVR